MVSHVSITKKITCNNALCRKFIASRKANSHDVINCFLVVDCLTAASNYLCDSGELLSASNRHTKNKHTCQHLYGKQLSARNIFIFMHDCSYNSTNNKQTNKIRKNIILTRVIMYSKLYKAYIGLM